MKNQYNLGNTLNPSFFLKKSQNFFPYMAISSLAFLFAGAYLALFVAPVDYVQGEEYRILYVHVPAAWFSSNCYYLLAISSAAYLVAKNPFYRIFSKVSAQIGCFFTLLTLFTGCLWGKPMWGTYWVWDARLTSVLFLLFFYAAYLLLIQFREKNFNTIASMFSVFGLINIPIIKFSVKWWSTLHQPASITRLESSMHLSMLYPLLVMIIAFSLITIIFYILLVRSELLYQKIHTYEKNIGLPHIK